MQFIDYSSTFNTIVPSKRITKIKDPGTEHLLQLDPGLPDGCPEAVREGNNTSATVTLNTGAHQGCVINRFLYSLFSHNCVATHNSNTIFNC
jgi:hypothetical protein